MLEILETYDALNDGLIPAAALRSSGVNSSAIGALVHRGELVRVRTGWYVLGPKWRAEQPDGRYRFLVRATAAHAGSELLLSHHSAAVMHGLPLIGAWPATTHALFPEARGGSSHPLLTAHRGMPDPTSTRVAGVKVTGLARTVVDMAAGSSFLIGVAMVDHVLHQEASRLKAQRETGIRGMPPITKDTLLTELAVVHPRVGWRAAHRAIAFANELSANAGESLSRVRFEELGFEIPELQVRFDVNGRTFYVDFLWRSVRKIGEFDGDMKYTLAAVMDGKDAAGVVKAEKKREDLLRPLVNSFDRWDWDRAFNSQAFYRFLCEKGVPRAQVLRPRKHLPGAALV
ncbi:hypothetical protein JF66_14615 [Cryobacterium sp. MLB-32]|uniref:hypothetical protein n=1 Tax=Cryobacterium sp. MLB-32 TaxID=1529318 RepID=UPI0004E725B0|nr:hypothetical protein [Cryobacterium sp. MLB-32]KFF58969.1 hypothetical protein JF66_14615 [Cryobacterium sp. MLB-32]